ncbi:MAG: hypothetical protein FD147_664 [Chloroflexi bacterium]|nr:MAG: hypothetical protein FD147_664 [Chloroflexota bacterium]MBA4375099.1 hypothetical protein [Anaerolinea sp.]
MKVTIEFTGVAKSITKENKIVLDILQGSTYQDLVRLLASKFPGLIGVLIAPDGETFLSSNMFVINGDLAFPAMIMGNSPSNGERIHLMSVITGG